MHLYKLNDTTKIIPIFMADSTAPLNGKTGLTLAVTLSKNGAAFVAAAGSVTETGGGNYYLTPTSVDSGTLGPMNMRATSAGAVDFNTVLQVVSFDPYSATNLGLSNLDATVSSRSTYAGTDTSGTTTLLSRVTGAVALAAQIPASFTSATFASAGVFATAALVNAPTGGGGGGIVTGYATGLDPATLLLLNPANKLATDASGRVTLAPAGLDAVTTEAGVNHRQAQALILAACTSICTVPSGAGTVNFKNAAGTQRIAVVVDGAGNRTAVTYSPPA